MYHVGSESQVFRFGDKYLNPLNHLTTPLYANFKNYFRERGVGQGERKGKREGGRDAGRERRESEKERLLS